MYVVKYVVMYAVKYVYSGDMVMVKVNTVSTSRGLDLMVKVDTVSTSRGLDLMRLPARSCCGVYI